MADRQITCINKAPYHDDPYHRINNVGGTWGKTSQVQAIADIRNSTHTYFVNVDGLRTNVIVKISKYNNPYLTTERDGETQNNLLKLPECP